MPKIPSKSPATGQALPPDYVHTTDGAFVDAHGRTLLLRGVNLSGSSKAPVDRPSYLLEGLWDTAEKGGESFGARPLDLEDGSADVHLARLRGWGFNVLRYVVTWESLEHEGPGKYDDDFMDYTVRVLRKCKEHGFRVYMDPHQDVWSRFSGGSGAPFWTLAACGIEPRNITPTQSSIVHAEYPSASAPNPASLPAMIWSTNYARLVSHTCYTLFFAGRAFAPKCVIDGVNIQDYLQSHFLAAFERLANRIRDATDLFDSCVIAWDSMNEPHHGLCGYDDLNKLGSDTTAQLRKGSAPTPAQSFKLGMGKKQTVEEWTFGSFGPRKSGSVTIDPKGVKLWADPKTEPGGVNERWGWTRDPAWQLGTCVWAQHGVWDAQTGAMLLPNYFKFHPQDSDRAVEFVTDFWRPHWRAYAQRVRSIHPEAIVFVQPPVFAVPAPLEDKDTRGRCAYSAHYYDGLTLVSRHWNWFNADALGMMRGRYSSILQAVRIGESAIRKSLREQLAIFKEDVAQNIGAYPTIIGEIGTPYDMDGKRAYGYTDGGKYKGDYSRQQSALDASLNGADGDNVMSYTVWTYCPDSTHQWGDGWNMEDLSLWSADDLKANRTGRYRMEQPGGRRSVGASTVTLGGGSAGASTAALLQSASASPQILLKLPKALAGAQSPDWTSVYDLLTDGARAVKAFSRPYPVATVGVPTDINFDIAKTTFSLRVLVRAEDKPRRIASEDNGTSEPSPVSDEGEEEVATEVYVPLVHYASDALLARNGGSVYKDDPDESGTPTGMRTPAYASSATLVAGTNAEPLAIDVAVSGGRWEVEGQILRWWYPVPRAGEPPVDYTLQIKRLGGAVKMMNEGKLPWWKGCLDGCLVM